MDPKELNAVDCIYGTTYADTYIQTQLTFYTSMWGSLRLAPIIQVASLAQLLRPSSPTVSNPAPDSSLCRAAAPRLRPLAPQMCPLQLLLAACVRFESAAAPWPDCIRFNCCSPFESASSCCSLIAPTSAAACCMFATCVCFSCCSDRVRFDCCSPIASASTAAPRLHASVCSPSWIPAQCSRTFFVEFEVQ